jgi:hypothetical protein
MTLPEFLRFTPVQLRTQHNGFRVKQQLRFIVALARGASVSEAAHAVGMTRQSVYRIRRRPDAESFAAAWDNAIEFARRVEAARRSPAAVPGTIETILVPRYYRGRLIGYVQREDLAGAMRLLGQLDRMAERLGDVPTLIRAAIDDIYARSDRSDGFPL